MFEAPPLQPTRSHVPPLDGLRGIAVLLVLWAHFPPDLGGNTIRVMNRIFQPGYLGVDIFFVLSGFLITRILLYGRFNNKPLKNFLIRRAFRIFPIYYLLILLLLFIEPGEYLFWCATYLSNFVFSFDLSPNPMRHTWSLCVEEHFYMVWPLLIHFAAVRWLRPSAIGIALLGIVLAILAALLSGVVPLDYLLYRGTPFRATSLALGGLFALYEPALGIGTRRPWVFAGAFFVPAVICALSAIGIGDPWLQSLKMIGFAFMSSAIFLAALGVGSLSPRLGAVLSGGALAYTGRISYGIYLYHYPLFYATGVLDHDAPAPWPMTLLAVALTFVVATSSFYLIEKPLLKYAARFR
jgi:peptidoglycan/LPS O-acetylase OafA/YrhL